MYGMFSSGLASDLMAAFLFSAFFAGARSVFFTERFAIFFALDFFAIRTMA